MKVYNFVARAAIMAAIAGSAASAFGGTVTAGADVFSIQFGAREAAISATSTQAMPAVTYTAAVAAVSGDRVTITLGGTAGANFSKTAINSTTADASAAHFGRLRCNGNATTLDQTSGTATTRVFTVPAAGCPTGAYSFDSATLTNTSLIIAGTVTVQVTTTRAEATVETAPAATVATVANELAATTAAASRWKGQIDSAAGSKSFVAASTAGTSTTTDTLLIDLDDNTVVNGVTLDTAVAGVLTLNGSWDFLKNGTETCAVPTAATDNKIVITDVTAAAAVGTVTAATCSSIEISFTKAEVDALTNAASDLKIDIVNAAAGNFLAPQTFSGSFAWKYSTTASAVTQTKTDTPTLGAQTASGIVAFVPYMPVGSGISQILYVTNTTNTSGSVSITSRDSAGVACTSYPATTVGPRAVVNLGPALAAGIAACGGSAATNKLALTITAELPDGGLEVYSAYNVSGNRVNVINSTNGRNIAGGVGSDNASR
jgi:hypothetical protein